MRILAITDGSIAALDIIEPLNGTVPIDLHVLPHPIPNKIKRAEVGVLAFDHFPTRSLEKLFDWLRDQGLRRAPVVLCLTAEEVARFSSAMRQISATIVSVPATSDTLLDAVEKSYRPFRGFRRQAAAGAACAEVQSLASSYASVLSGKKPPAKGTVDQIAEAGAEVSKVVRTHGLESWMAAVGLHHSYTARHCISVAGFAADWAHKLKFSDADQKLFTQAGLLHDIGKMWCRLRSWTSQRKADRRGARHHQSPSRRRIERLSIKNLQCQRYRQGCRLTRTTSMLDGSADTHAA
jgi:putative nucleotidyltransferase with HDIG domain